MQSRPEIISAVAQSLGQMTETATNIETVVDRAGIPEQEVIAEFGSMHGLVLALVTELIDAVCRPLQDAPRGEEEFTRRLLQFGQSLEEAYSFSHLRGLYRIAITESIRNSGLGPKFYEAGPNLLTERLASFLEMAQQAGAIGPVDSRLAAEHFLSLIRADLHLNEDSSGSYPSREEHARAAAEQAVALFQGGILGRKE